MSSRANEFAWMTEDPRVPLHLDTITTSLNELFAIADKTKAPAPEQYRKVGVITGNTLALLTGVANCLDCGNRSLSYADFESWLEALKAVHRSFYSSILIAVQMSLEELCEAENIEVENGRINDAEDVIAGLKNTMDEKVFADNAVEDQVRSLIDGNLGFRDYLAAVLKAKIERRCDRTPWREFFHGLSIIRNKVSHSDPSLTPYEVATLRAGRLANHVDANGDLQANTRNYKFVLELVMEFYAEIGIPLVSI